MAILKQSAVPIDTSYKRQSLLLWIKAMLSQIIAVETTVGSTAPNKTVLSQTKWSKALLPMTVLFGGFILSACQTAPLSPTIPTVTPSPSTTVASQSAAEPTITITKADEPDGDDYAIDDYAAEKHSDDNYPNEDANEYPIEPYILPSQTTTSSYPTQNTPDVVTYEQVNEANNESNASTSSNRDAYTTVT